MFGWLFFSTCWIVCGVADDDHNWLTRVRCVIKVLCCTKLILSPLLLAIHSIAAVTIMGLQIFTERDTLFSLIPAPPSAKVALNSTDWLTRIDHRRHRFHSVLIKIIYIKDLQFVTKVVLLHVRYLIVPFATIFCDSFAKF